jgi:threonine synthase
VAGVRQLAASGRLERSAVVVCILTGHGLKDPDTGPGPPLDELVPIPPTAAAIREAIGG